MKAISDINNAVPAASAPKRVVLPPVIFPSDEPITSDIAEVTETTNGLYLDVTRNDGGFLRPCGVNLLKLFDHIGMAYKTSLRDRHPNRIFREQAVKSFCVMRVPRFQEIFNDYHGRGTLSRARSSEKHRHEQRDHDLEH